MSRVGWAERENSMQERQLHAWAAVACFPASTEVAEAQAHEKTLPLIEKPCFDVHPETVAALYPLPSFRGTMPCHELVPEYFVGPKTADPFRCHIGHCVFDQPVCAPCGHTFCTFCLSEWLHNYEVCPIGRTAVTSADSLMRLPQRLTNVLPTLSIRCQRSDCGAIVSLGDFAGHMSTCEA